MKKTFLSLAALLLVCLAFYGWSPLLQEPSSPQMEAYYIESSNLKSVPVDSANRFIVNFWGYTISNPLAKYDPLYSKIETNIQEYSSTH